MSTLSDADASGVDKHLAPLSTTLESFKKQDDDDEQWLSTFFTLEEGLMDLDGNLTSVDSLATYLCSSRGAQALQLLPSVVRLAVARDQFAFSKVHAQLLARLPGRVDDEEGYLTSQDSMPSLPLAALAVAAPSDCEEAKHIPRALRRIAHNARSCEQRLAWRHSVTTAASYVAHLQFCAMRIPLDDRDEKKDCMRQLSLRAATLVQQECATDAAMRMKDDAAAIRALLSAALRRDHDDDSQLDAALHRALKFVYALENSGKGDSLTSEVFDAFKNDGKGDEYVVASGVELVNTLGAYPTSLARSSTWSDIVFAFSGPLVTQAVGERAWWFTFSRVVRELVRDGSCMQAIDEFCTLPLVRRRGFPGDILPRLLHVLGAVDRPCAQFAALRITLHPGATLLPQKCFEEAVASSLHFPPCVHVSLVDLFLRIREASAQSSDGEESTTHTEA